MMVLGVCEIGSRWAFTNMVRVPSTASISPAPLFVPPGKPDKTKERIQEGEEKRSFRLLHIVNLVRPIACWKPPVPSLLYVLGASISLFPVLCC